MKKKKLALSKKLNLSKSTVAELTPAQQGAVNGGISGTILCTTTETMTSMCLATKPRPNQACCQIW
ncbi:hypothetical protein LX64_01409 [Chitinophaga skermanii]|uniref:Uncharacterized protein n=1 Tax=Chitinophaga skermanii TaxID=331697 RepID=A0A327QXQ8_9BACT|nr:class I lanthipeptide [Chitinophaga skermanii]RAJ08755.1 hypothetical protein LX64_01409 [Chitinophaga skermanii]